MLFAFKNFKQLKLCKQHINIAFNFNIEKLEHQNRYHTMF